MTARPHVHDDAQAAAQACAHQIGAWLAEAVRERGRAGLAVSGGSTPKLMFQAMCAMPFDWSRIHLFWVDERGVPPDDEQSNYRMTREHLILPAAIPQTNIHRIHAERDARDAALAYAEDIEAFFALQPGQLPQFDVVQCGVGGDGHTASLFPGEPLIADRRGIAAGVWVEKMRQWRITLLPGVLLAARHLCVLASGADKAAALASALDVEQTPLLVPAQLLRNAEWYIDTASAAQIQVS